LRERDHVARELVLLERHDRVVARADDVGQCAGGQLGEQLLVVLALGRGEVHLHLVLGVLLRVGIEDRVPELLLGDAAGGVGHHDLDRAGRGVRGGGRGGRLRRLGRLGRGAGGGRRGRRGGGRRGRRGRG